MCGFLCTLQQIGGDFCLFPVGAKGFIMEEVGFHANKVDHAFEFAFSANGAVNGDGIGMRVFRA